MANETSHIKNVANLKTLYKFVESKPDYKPVNPAITAPALKQLYDDSLPLAIAVNTTLTPYNSAVKLQQQAFNKLSKLVRRLTNNFVTTVNNDEQAERAISLANRISYAGKGNNKKTDKPAADTEAGSDVSTSHLSYDNRIANFEAYIEVLEFNTYAPNETEFTTKELRSFLTELKTLTEAVDDVEIPYKAALKDRNEVMYVPETGLIDTVKAAKKYAKSIFGYGSAEMLFINELKFYKGK